MKPILLSLVITSVTCCLLSGKEIGLCSSGSLPYSSFCFDHVKGFVCVPAHNVTWSQYDASYRDQEIERVVLTHLQDQLILEYSQLTSRLQISNNPACYEAYKRFICQWNFPECNPTTDTSNQVCQSLCNSFQTACGGTTDACSIIYANRDLGLNPAC